MPDSTVSFVVVAKNAARYFPDLFKDILAQEYQSERMELILVAGPSSDGTLQCMQRFRAEHPERKILVLENPAGTLAAGWNIALSHASGDVILRVDAHTCFSTCFVSRSVEAIRNGEDIVGGLRRTTLPDKAWQRLLAIAEMSNFGGGSAGYRKARHPGYVGTLAHAAYRRDVFRNVGGYDERLGRTEDNEIHFRMRQAGYKFYYSPAIESLHFARHSLTGMLRQKYGNGLWIGLTMGIQPRCFSLRHFIPGAFVASLAISIVFGALWNWLPLFTIMTVYGLGAIGYAIREVARSEASRCRQLCVCLPVLFLLIHLSYGLGTVVGLLKMPFFAWRTRGYVVPRPIQ
jgi:glycosyltransferase involved in cell wall biosynthesis